MRDALFPCRGGSQPGRSSRSAARRTPPGSPRLRRTRSASFCLKCSRRSGCSSISTASSEIASGVASSWSSSGKSRSPARMFGRPMWAMLRLRLRSSPFRRHQRRAAVDDDHRLLQDRRFQRRRAGLGDDQIAARQHVIGQPFADDQRRRAGLSATARTALSSSAVGAGTVKPSLVASSGGSQRRLGGMRDLGQFVPGLVHQQLQPRGPARRAAVRAGRSPRPARAARTTAERRRTGRRECGA